MTILYWYDYLNRDKYQKERENTLNAQADNLKQRESLVVDKEICFRELTKLKTIQNSIYDILKQDNSPHQEL